MISHHHKCIFIHIPKCGGQSIEHMFLDEVGLTWESRAPLLLRSKVAGELAPPIRLAHLTAEEYIDYKYVSRDLFDQYYKFSVVRNPYSRVVSIYKHLNFDHLMSLENFVNEYLPLAVNDNNHALNWFVRQQNEFVLDKHGKNLADKIIKLEEINEKFVEVANSVGIHNTTPPHVNKHGNKNFALSLKIKFNLFKTHMKIPPLSGIHNAELTNELKSSVVELYRHDFEYFNYDK